MINEFHIPSPYLLFTGNADSVQTDAKTAAGVADWSREKCLGQLWMKSTRVDLGLPHLSLEEAVKKGAKTLIVGVAPMGGRIENDWVDLFEKAIEAGLNIAAGLHTRLSSIDRLKSAANKYKKQLFDVRYYDGPIPPPSGKKRTGKRLLTVGTDCAVGKKYATLAIAKKMKEKGLDATFRATGQTGILIEGSGIAIDNLICDDCFGGVELLSPNAKKDHWDVIEGQAAFFHPWGGVTLMLVQGSQPDVMVLCHNPARKSLLHLEHFPIREIPEYIEAYERAAKFTNPKAKVEAISLNTSEFKDKKEAIALIQNFEKKYKLPCFDPIFTDVGPFVDILIEKYS